MAYRSIARTYTRQRYPRSNAWLPPAVSGPRFAMPHQSYCPNINRAALAGSVAAKRLASDLAELAAIHGAATDADLETLGWPKTMLALYGEAARELASAAAAREAGQ